MTKREKIVKYAGSIVVSFNLMQMKTCKVNASDFNKMPTSQLERQVLKEQLDLCEAEKYILKEIAEGSYGDYLDISEKYNNSTNHLNACNRNLSERDEEISRCNFDSVQLKKIIDEAKSNSTSVILVFLGAATLLLRNAKICMNNYCPQEREK